LLGAIAIAAFGCTTYQAHVRRGSSFVDAANVPSPVVASATVWGYHVGETSTNECVHGMSWVEVRHNAWQALFSIITFGLYSPANITIGCMPPPQQLATAQNSSLQSGVDAAASADASADATEGATTP
jgi:hypothetical protein